VFDRQLYRHELYFSLNTIKIRVF